MLQNMIRGMLIAAALIFCQLVVAQDADTITVQRVKVSLRNEEVYVGSIVRQDGRVVVLETAVGEVNVPSAMIHRIDYMEASVNSKFRYPNPNETRYLFGPTAIPLEQGEGYYQNVLLSSNFVNFGLTNHFSVGGGLELVSVLMRQPIFFLTPKFGFEAGENMYLGAGMLAILPQGGGQFLLPFGLATFGSSESNVTFSLGVPFVEGRADNGGLFSVAGFHRFRLILFLRC